MSRLPFELFLAWRYLKPKRTFVSVITLISVVGVMLGVAVLIIVISVMTGFDQELQARILGFNAHLRVTREGGSMTNHEGLRALVLSNSMVRAAAPLIQDRALTETMPAYGNPIIQAPNVRGVDWALETNMHAWHTNLIAGQPDLDGHGVLIGYEFARQMQLVIGDTLAIHSPEALRAMYDSYQKDEDLPEPSAFFTVRGIFDVGYYDYDSSVIVTSLANAQDLYRLGQGVQGLMVMLHDPFQAEVVRKHLLNLLGPGYHISLWTEENSGLLDALVVEKNAMFAVLFFIMIVAAFGIMNSLITFVVQKTREIGVLKALGATPSQIMGLFLSQGLTVGLAGVLIGFGLGMFAVHFRGEILQVLRFWARTEVFTSSVFSQLPAKIVSSDILLICGSALFICLLAALVPAWKASRLQPVQALRHE